MADWKDILSRNGAPPNKEELINYIDNNLTEEERHALESKLIDSSFEDDALEGLQSLKSGKDINAYVQQLNKNLHQQLEAKKKRKLKRQIKEYPWATITILLLLAICIIGYVVIHFFMRDAG